MSVARNSPKVQNIVKEQLKTGAEVVEKHNHNPRPGENKFYFPNHSN